MKQTALLLLIVTTFFSCKNKTIASNELGEIEMTVTGTPEAAIQFEKGLLLLHSFEYEDARDAFLQAQTLDPDMAMAFWGEAMTYNHSLWREQDYELANEVLQKLEKIDYNNTCTPLELDFIKAVKLLYQPQLEKVERDNNYSAFMETLTQKYPENHEVAAFYALSLLGSVPDGRDDDIYEKGALIAKGIIEENPNHPGALHYLIHSYDDPKHAHLALTAADSYAEVAPDASHALHMPSHIYVALGMWDQVISSNENSYQASLNRMERKNLGNDARGYHAYHWLQYGQLQKENVDEAKLMLNEMTNYVKESPSKRARTHLVFLKGSYLVDTDQWNSKEANIDVDVSDLNVSVRSRYYFLEGMKAYHNEDSKALDSIISNIEYDINREEYILSDYGGTFCAAVSRDTATRSDVVATQIRMSQLQALQADLNNDLAKAEQLFIKSIELDGTISYSYGPPAIQKPTRELYADWLLRQDRKDNAKAQYELSLKKNPNRTHVVKGIKSCTM